MNTFDYKIDCLKICLNKLKVSVFRPRRISAAAGLKSGQLNLKRN